MAQDNCPSPCDRPLTGSACEWIFDQIRVYPKIDGGTRVEWTIHPRFGDPEPYSFQLQMGRTGNPDADDWCDIGSPVTGACYGIDDVKRVYGKFQWTHYRVVLTTPNGVYASKPQNALGVLDRRDWLRAREIVRLERLRLVKEAGQQGVLLKRRLYGTECPDCLDSQTKEIRNPQCENCFGTGFDNGYFEPYQDFWVELKDLAAGDSRSHLDAGQGRGTIDDLARSMGRMINTPQVFSYDVWVETDTDQRWIFHTIKNKVNVRGVPLICEVEMRLAPFTHPVYKFEVD